MQDTDIDLLILCWHQVYIKGFSGGYIRLREFLRRIPSDLRYQVVDNHPSIYTDVVPKPLLLEYHSPLIINWLKSKLFILWYLMELISSTVIIYQKAGKLIEEKRIKIIYVPTGEFINLFISAILLKRKYPQIKLVIDILNFDIDNCFLYFQKLLKSRIGIVRTVIIFLYGSLSKFIIRRDICSADYIFTVSPELVSRLKKIYGKDTIGFTPSGVNTNVSFHKQVKNKKHAGVFIGRLSPQKGIFDLLQVWAKVVEKKPNATLAIGGYCHREIMDEVKKDIKKLNLKNTIILLGSLSEKEKYQLLSDSEIFIHLARYEPLFPVISLLEGFACGLPAVIYDMPVVSSQEKLLHGNDFLFIVRNGQIKEAAQKILYYLSLENPQKKMISQRAKRFAAVYDWETIARKEFKVINSFLSNEK